MGGKRLEKRRKNLAAKASKINLKNKNVVYISYWKMQRKIWFFSQECLSENCRSVLGNTYAHYLASSNMLEWYYGQGELSGAIRRRTQRLCRHLQGVPWAGVSSWWGMLLMTATEWPGTKPPQLANQYSTGHWHPGGQPAPAPRPAQSHTTPVKLSAQHREWMRSNIFRYTEVSKSHFFTQWLAKSQWKSMGLTKL